MDDNRSRKIEAGRRKLDAYKRKKQRENKNNSGSASTSGSGEDSLNSFTSPPLPDNTKQEEQLSDNSLISEHISSNESVENDRSLQEIEISNLPTDFSLMLDNLPSENDGRISQEAKPPSLNSSLISESSVVNFVKLPSPNLEVTQNVQSILEEILKNEQFKSDSLSANRYSGESSKEESLNIFENVNLDDSSLNDYFKHQVHLTGCDSVSLNEKNLDEGNFALDDAQVGVASAESVGEALKQVKDMEELLAVKDTTIASLNAELESVREQSNPSTLSFATSTTDYRPYQEEYHNRLVEFQNAVAHRDNLIEQLTDSLQQSLAVREELRLQSENFAAQIVELQKQLAETSEVIKQHHCQTKQNLKKDEISEDVEKAEDLLDSVKDVEDLAEMEPLSLSSLNTPGDVKSVINRYIKQKLEDFKGRYQQELQALEFKMEKEKGEHESEVAKLRELLAQIKCDPTEIVELREELDKKHAREMEELRTYFEQKCADLEKHYSDEIFSRKMSGSSSCSELTSDLLYSGSQPPAGPGGDSGPISFDLNKLEGAKRDLNTLTKNDLVKLKADLDCISKEFANYNLDKITKQELNTLKSEIAKYDLRNLAKYDLSLLRAELQNKYHAELEILREDYENKIDLMNVHHQDRLRSMERNYLDKIEALKFDLDEAMRMAQNRASSAVQEVGSSGEFEIGEVVQSYERRLQEQVALAKFDIIAALETQIQRLAADETDDEEWPEELLKLRDRFTERYELQIGELNERHLEEITQLKDEHHKILSGALERARRRSLREGESTQEFDLIKERDALLKTTTVLRHLVGELMKYFTQCEDELNSTLVEELLKHGFEKNLTEIEGELSFNDSTSSKTETKRVHLTPDFSEFLKVLDSSALDSIGSKEISVDFKNELELCLEKLKADANAVLALTVNLSHRTGVKTDNSVKNTSLEEKVTSLTRQLIEETQNKNDLVDKVNELEKHIDNLELERSRLELHAEELIERQNVMERDLSQARGKIGELIESGRKEIVSEGYGENLTGSNRNLSGKVSTLAELQERARVALSESTMGDQSLLRLVEELSQAGEHLTEEAKKDHDDLVQQVEAADKKYKATCQFLEEQASEREQERDEAQKEIQALREQLRERDKDRASCERVYGEVEQLEQQMREMSKLIEANELKQQETEQERKEAVEKIWVLRDIIRDLEAQVETKAEAEAELRNLVLELQDVVKQQSRANLELTERLEAVKDVGEGRQLQGHIKYLEEELQRFRLNSELAGSEGALRQIKGQLTDFEATLDKRTLDLEGLHSTISTTCSSPSEDMSIRDQVRPRTPANVLDECDVPLQQLARLKEKLIRHSRAEDAAMKRIRDLEMQLSGIKKEFDEVQNERDALQDQVQEQLMLISSLQIRLDDQRLIAEDVQKQRNTSLEVRIYDLENEAKSLRETIHSRDKTIKQLNNTLEHTKQRLEILQNELQSQKEDDVILKLRKEIEELQVDNKMLQMKIDSNAQSAQILPNLVDNILADKNADIEKLRDKLEDTEKQLQSYLSLNLDHEQLKNLSQLKTSDRALADMLSLVGEHARRAESRNISIGSPELNFKRTTNETTPVLGLDCTPEISTIEKVGPPNVNYTIDAPLIKPNSTEIQKHVHFEDTRILELKNELHLKEEMLKEYSAKIEAIVVLENKIEKLQENLEKTEEALKVATEAFEKEQSNMRDLEKNLRVELAEKKMHMMERDKKLEVYEQDSVRKDQMYINLAKEKREIEKQLQVLYTENECYKNFDNIMAEKNREIYRLEERLAEISEPDPKIERLEYDLKQAKEESNVLIVKLSELQKEIEGNVKVMGELREEKERTEFELQEKLKKLQDILIDRECEIEILNEDLKHFQDELEVLRKSEKPIDTLEKDSLIKDLTNKFEDSNREVQRLQTLLNEKEKIIRQMSEDSKRLHSNLETIQNKIQETGNIIDLAKRLRDEQKLNVELQEEVHLLKANLLAQEQRPPSDIELSIEEIAGKVQRELDFSAHLDSSILSALEEGGDRLDVLDAENIKDTLLKERKLNNELKKSNEKLQKDVIECRHNLRLAEGNVQKLKRLLDNEKASTVEMQQEDARLLERMRIKLDGALDNENELEKLLDDEKRTCNDLKSQIVVLKQKLDSAGSNSYSKTNLTEYKSLPTVGNQELIRLRANLELLQNENGSLKGEIKELKRSLREEESSFKYVNDLLQSKNKELEQFQKELGEMKEAEKELKERINMRESEVDNARILMDEMDQDRLSLKKKLNEQNKKIRELEMKIPEIERQHLNMPIPDKLAKKIKELSNLVKDNKQMTDTLSRLTDERKLLQERIKELEQQQNNPLTFTDPVARANHLFARYLRADSYRKALIWQKRYLMALLAEYQDVTPITEKLRLLGVTPKTKRTTVSVGKARFRSIAIAVMSVLRMQFLVQRWHSGKRMVVSINSRHHTQVQSRLSQFHVGLPVSDQHFTPLPTQAYIGLNRISASQHEVPSERRYRDFNDVRSDPTSNGRPSAFEDLRVQSPVVEMEQPSWSGTTPPSRDKQGRGEVADKFGVTDMNPDRFLPLRAPEILSRYVERFNEIQSRLELTARVSKQ